MQKFQKLPPSEGVKQECSGQN